MIYITCSTYPTHMTNTTCVTYMTYMTYMQRSATLLPKVAVLDLNVIGIFQSG
jgi:hypothetical protein